MTSLCMNRSFQATVVVPDGYDRAAYPYLEPDDISEALAYAAWRAEEVELPLRSA